MGYKGQTSSGLNADIRQSHSRERHNMYKGALEAIMDELNWHPSELTKAEKKIREIASKALGETMTITIQCRSYQESVDLRTHLLQVRPFTLADVPNPVALHVGNELSVYTDTDYNKLYVDGWLSGYRLGLSRWPIG